MSGRHARNLATDLGAAGRACAPPPPCAPPHPRAVDSRDGAGGPPRPPRLPLRLRRHRPRRHARRTRPHRAAHGRPGPLVAEAFQDVEALFELGIGADARLAQTAASLGCCGDAGPFLTPPRAATARPSPTGAPGSTSSRQTAATARPSRTDRPPALEATAPPSRTVRPPASPPTPRSTPASTTRPTAWATSSSSPTGAPGRRRLDRPPPARPLRRPRRRRRHGRGRRRRDRHLTFLTYADLAAFLTALDGGTNAYLTGTSDDAEAELHVGHHDVARRPGLLAPPRARPS